MVTIQDIGLRLTKSVKELAEWDYPFSETLETYCSLFNTTDSTSFGEAGLVLQNSTAVYVHRIDCLWSKTEYFRNIFSNYEHEEGTKGSIKKREKKTDLNFQDFKTINFAEEVETNIDIKKNHTTQETIKSRNRRFTQLEKGIAQHIPIDIYDVNGEVIGKKYDFRCNQNISMDGILVDEFAPQDFFSISNNSVLENSSLTSLDCSRVTESLECPSNTLMEDSMNHDDGGENANSDAESERNNDDLPIDGSNAVMSFESNQNLFLSRDTDNDTLTDKPCDTTNNSQNLTPSNTTNNIGITTPSDTSLLSPVNSTVLANNNDFDSEYLNNSIRESVDRDDHLLNGQLEPVNSPERRILSTNDLVSLDNTGDYSPKTKPNNNPIQNTPSTGSPRHKSRLRSKSTPKSRNRNRDVVTLKKKGRIAKNLLNEFQKKNIVRTLEKSMFSQTDRPSMFHENLSTCIKYIREYDPLQYDDVTNVALDFLGFRLHVTESNTNAKDNVTTTSTDDEMFELHSSSPTSPIHENFCDTWFQSDSPCFLPENVDKWHDLMQPKLREAEQRSTFCIRDYASRIMDSLKTSDQQRINFNDVIRRENNYEVARYFLASLDLASRQDVDINMDKSIEGNIEIALHEDDRQCVSNDEMDSHD